MQKIGPCKFLELPQKYQDQFESGSLHSTAGHFFPFDPSVIPVPIAALLGVFYILLGIGAIFVLPYWFYQDPARWSRLINETTSGVFQFLATIAIFGVIAWGVFYMFNVGLRSLASVIAWVEIKRAGTIGKHHYGLLLDEKNLVLRQGNYLADYVCAFVPKNAIQACFTGNIWIEGAKHRINLDVVKVRYIDEQEYSDELVLKEHFLMSAPEMRDQIQQWLQLSKESHQQDI